MDCSTKDENNKKKEPHNNNDDGTISSGNTTDEDETTNISHAHRKHGNAKDSDDQERHGSLKNVSGNHNWEIENFI